MSTAAKHYDDLLAEHYLWMFGVPFAAKVAEQKVLIERAAAVLGRDLGRGAAFDLGSGPGFQSLALAELGFSPVTAIDSSQRLLDELVARRTSQAIQVQHADLTALRSLDLVTGASIAVCMGDTLTHLPSKSAVETLFSDVYRLLSPGALLVLTYRDLTAELKGIDRFLPVRADAEKIMTCFLEYTSDDQVMIHDLIHVRNGDEWGLRKSSYPKLRLAPEWVATALRAAGFARVEHELAGRLLLCCAAR